ncbi:EamA family transporter [Streptomyces sp. NPDC002730]|uniref:EamA family transporter n=1 Tax=Streptomyces sp. NPDC002730 TaxID=3364662 RepID=UPI0036997576
MAAWAGTECPGCGWSWSRTTTPGRGCAEDAAVRSCQRRSAAPDSHGHRFDPRCLHRCALPGCAVPAARRDLGSELSPRQSGAARGDLTQVVWTRMVLGAATLGVIAVFRRRRPRMGVRLWGHLALLSLLLCTAPFLLYAQAERHIHSSLASSINATTPLLTALLSGLLARGDKAPEGGGRAIGLMTGFTGVVLIVAHGKPLGTTTASGRQPCAWPLPSATPWDSSTSSAAFHHVPCLPMMSRSATSSPEP